MLPGSIVSYKHLLTYQQLFSQLYYLPVYFEGVQGFSIIHTGLTFLPITCTMIIGSLGAGVLIHEASRLPWVIMIGWVLATISSSLLFLLNQTTPTYCWILIFLVLGIGHGIMIMSLNYALQTIVQKHHVGQAMSMYTFMRALGMCIGIAAGSSLLQSALKSRLGSGSASALMDISDLAAHPELPLALLTSFRYTCTVMTGVSILGFLISFVFVFSSCFNKEYHQQLN